MLVLSHQLATVALSVMAAVLSAITAIPLAIRSAHTQGLTRQAWSAASAFALGVGIWSMHFIGMLALRYPLDLGFDALKTALSLLPALAGSLGLLVVALRPKSSLGLMLVAPALTAAGIVVMHYMGMQAIEDAPPLFYTSESVVWAYLVAYLASLLGFLAMRKIVKSKRPSVLRIIVAGTALGIAASGMHHTAMAGTYFGGQRVCITDYVSIPDASLLGITGQHGWLAVVIFLMLVIVNATGLLASIYDARLEDGNRRRARELEALNAELDQRAAKLARELAREQSVFGAAAEATRDGIFSWRPSTGELFLSRYGRALFGIEADQPMHGLEDLAEHMADEDQPRFLAAAREVIRDTRKLLALDVRLADQDGQERWVLVRGRLVSDGAGGEPLLVGAASDISVQKKAQTEAVALADRQREVATLRSQIIRILSHELRTPLAILTTGADLLRALSRPAERVSQEKIDGYFNNMESAIEKVKDILQEALQYNRLESGEMVAKPEPTHLRQAVAEVARWCCQGQGQPNDRIQLEGPADWGLVNLDPSLLDQILRNLLVNALKYSENQTVTVRFSRLAPGAADAPARIELSVQDQGIGIPEDLVPQLFEPFARGSNVGNRPGTGLGLSIAHRAAEVMGGRLTLVSTGPRGSCFCLSLPA